MKNLHLIALLCLNGLFVQVGAAAEEDGFLLLLKNRKTWEAFNWKNADQSVLWQMSGWVQSDEQSQLEGFLLERPTQLSGKPATARLKAVADGDSSHKRLILTAMNRTHGDCKNLEKWISSGFGKPSVVVDASFEQDVQVKGNTVYFSEKQVEWNLGNTRIQLRCDGLALKKELLEKLSFYSALIIADNKDIEAIKPLVGLKCEEGDKGDTSFYIIDDNKRKVLSADKIPFGGVNVVTDQSIKMEIVDRGDRLGMSINRVTGQLTGSVSSSRGKVSKTSGFCKKFNINKPMF